MADVDELRALLVPLHDARKGVAALLPGGVIPNRQVFDIQRDVGRPITWTALLTVKNYPYHEKVVAENDAAPGTGSRCGPRSRAAPWSSR